MAKDDREVQLGEVADLLGELVALQAIALRQHFKHNSELIVAMSKAGFENPRIASLVGATTDTVRGVVNKAKGNKEQPS
ncbi:MAG: hypothetical protein OXN95_01690 [bacterium]|nr:hypothetical protein [bacterium]